MMRTGGNAVENACCAEVELAISSMASRHAQQIRALLMTDLFLIRQEG
jgi:hypothetical protein